MSGQDYGPGGYPPPDENGYGGRDRPDPGPREPRYDQSMGGVRGSGGEHLSAGGPAGGAGGFDDPHGPGYQGPGAMPPEPERRGPSAAAIVTIVVLGLALIILAVWWFTRDTGQDNAEPAPVPTSSAPAATEEASPTPSEEPTTEASTSEPASEPVESEAPTEEETAGEDDASPAPVPVPSAPSVDPGDDFNVEDYAILPDSLPPTIGDWQHTMVGGFDAYVRPDNAYVMVAGQGKDEEQINGFRDMMADLREFDGGFCGTLEDDGLGSFDQCYFQPGKAPDRFYNVMSAGEPPATLDELQEIAEAIASFQ